MLILSLIYLTYIDHLKTNFCLNNTYRYLILLPTKNLVCKTIPFHVYPFSPHPCLSFYRPPFSFLIIFTLYRQFYSNFTSYCNSGWLSSRYQSPASGNSSHYQGTAHTTREQFTPSAAGFFSAKSTESSTTWTFKIFWCFTTETISQLVQ